jgi:uncharacterized protein YoxC
MNATAFRLPAIDFAMAARHTFRCVMTPLAQAVVVICVAVVSAVLVATLLALRKTALRADRVLEQVEREIRPMLSQVDALTTELTTLSRSASEEMKQVSVIIRRVDEVSAKVSGLVGGLVAMTKYGQYAALLGGVKKGVEVFMGRLKAKP